MPREIVRRRAEAVPAVGSRIDSRLWCDRRRRGRDRPLVAMANSQWDASRSSGTLSKLEVDELTVRKLRVLEREGPPQAGG